jgi:hypothetical protein
VLPPDPGCIMAQLTTVPFRCRFDIASSDAGYVCGSQGEFCAFEFPGCEGCKFAVHAIRSVKAIEDPMRSVVWSGYVNCSQLSGMRD